MYVFEDKKTCKEVLGRGSIITEDDETSINKTALIDMLRLTLCTVCISGDKNKLAKSLNRIERDKNK